MSYGDKDLIKIVTNPWKECCKFVSKNFVNIIPFQIKTCFTFQIRFNKFNYLNLPEKIRISLQKFAYISDKTYCDDKCDVRYRKDFYWIHTDEYIFTFKCNDIIELYTKCKYDYDGIDEYKDRIIYIDNNSFTSFILNNIELASKDTPKM